MTSVGCSGSPTAQICRSPKEIPFRLSPLGFLFQGPQTLGGGGYTLSKHRHHVTQRTREFCANSALGCRQYRPHGSGLSNQREGMMGKEGQRSREDTVSEKMPPLLIPFLLSLLPVPCKWPLASSSFQADLLDGALGVSEGRPPALSHASASPYMCAPRMSAYLLTEQ